MTEKSAHVNASKILCIVFAGVGTVLAILSVFVACVECFAFNRNYYTDEYAKLNTAAYVGVDEPELNNATSILLDYLEGKRDNIDFAYWDGTQIKEYYTEREKAHMVDVAQLNLDAVSFAWAAFPIGAALLILAYFQKQRCLMWKSVFITTLTVTAFFAIIGIWVVADFDVFWISFHKVFFNNDLWLLDPRSSLMIRMFNTQFFFDMVAGILAILILIIAGILILSGLLMRKYRRSTN